MRGIYASFLPGARAANKDWTNLFAQAHDRPMPHDHADDDHPHALLPPDPALRVKALETILIEKGLIDPSAIDAIIEQYEQF